MKKFAKCACPILLAGCITSVCALEPIAKITPKVGTLMPWSVTQIDTSRFLSTVPYELTCDVSAMSVDSMGMPLVFGFNVSSPGSFKSVSLNDQAIVPLNDKTAVLGLMKSINVDSNEKNGNTLTVKGLTIPFVLDPTTDPQPQLLFINVNSVALNVENCVAQVQLNQIRGIDTFLENYEY